MTEDKQQFGFTLVELMVSIALFALIVLAATSGLVASIARERTVRADVALQRGMYTFLDKLEYEVHLAKRVGCGSLESSCVDGGDILVMESAGGELILYQLSQGQVVRSQGGGGNIPAISGEFGGITNLSFYVRGALPGSSDPGNQQYLIVVAIEGQSTTGKGVYGYRYITPYALDIND